MTERIKIEQYYRLLATDIAPDVAYIRLSDIWPEGKDPITKNRRLPRRAFKAGDRVYNPDLDGESLLVVERGAVLISLACGSKREVVKRVDAGVIFGEVEDLGIQMLSAEAYAAEAATLIMLSPARATATVTRSVETWVRWSKMIIPKLAASRREWVLSMAPTPISRIVIALLRLANADGVISGMSQQTIADYAGVSRTSLSIKLREMVEPGLIEVARKEITLLDAPRLRGLVGSAKLIAKTDPLR
jgi:CRP-like cAMP-binding protein